MKNWIVTPVELLTSFTSYTTRLLQKQHAYVTIVYFPYSNVLQELYNDKI